MARKQAKKYTSDVQLELTEAISRHTRNKKQVAQSPREKRVPNETLLTTQARGNDQSGDWHLEEDTDGFGTDRRWIGIGRLIAAGDGAGLPQLEGQCTSQIPGVPVSAAFAAFVA